MAEHNDLGQLGEDLAAKYLEKNGYFIKAKNYRFSKFEIDLIAEKDGFVIFIEVKTRAGNFMEDPQLAVTRRKQAQVIKAADAYFKETDCQLESRFDIITVVFANKNHTIEHFESAYYPLAKR